MTSNLHLPSPVAVVTGGSRGLGRALAGALIDRGWSVVVDGRRGDELDAFARQVGSPRLHVVAGDVSDPIHREALTYTAARLGPVSLLVNNASRLGPSPQPALEDYPLDVLADVFAVNVLAPLAISQHLMHHLAAHRGVLINVSSDAAVEAYPGWGGYGSSKAALDQLSAVLAAEQAEVSVYAFDPGDMRTEMHQQAFPDEDISDRPEPESVVPAVLRLLDERPASGRYRAADLLASVPVGAGT
jgi:NAD(P)-dependent dehydrogenase (short-subunit alcohol dehydrogenase family)